MPNKVAPGAMFGMVVVPGGAADIPAPARTAYEFKVG